MGGRAIQVVDLFCGGGGESSGILAAVDRMGLNVELHAVNHWERAIETHAANHPEARHYCTGVDAIDPTKVAPGGRVELLWASPECTHHSTARGGRPCSDQSRASAWLILKWVQELYVERVIVENVPEFLNWGPLGADGRPMQSKRGATFHAWKSALESMGYRVEWRILNAADYGAATTRRRLFVQAVRGRKRIVWPTPTHGKETGGLLPGMGLRDWVPAREVIDWGVPGTSIFGRKRPLARNTLRRIEAGIERYWGKWAEPFLVILRGKSVTRDIDLPMPTVSCSGAHLGLVEPFLGVLRGTGTARDIDRPLPAVTAGGQHLGLVEPFVLATGQGGRVRGVRDPLSTVVTKAEHCVVEPFVCQSEHDCRVHGTGRPLPTITPSSRGFGVCEPLILHQMTPGRTREVSEPVPTITAAGAHALIMPYYGMSEAREVDEPLGTVTCRDRFALIQGVPCELDIRFRMLLPHELAAAQGFPSGYWFSGTRADQVRQIGNAVPPPFAEALTLAAFGGAGA